MYGLWVCLKSPCQIMVTYKNALLMWLFHSENWDNYFYSSGWRICMVMWKSSPENLPQKGKNQGVAMSQSQSRPFWNGQEEKDGRKDTEIFVLPAIMGRNGIVSKLWVNLIYWSVGKPLEVIYPGLIPTSIHLRGQSLFKGLISEKGLRWSQHEAQSLCWGSPNRSPVTFSLPSD